MKNIAAGIIQAILVVPNDKIIQNIIINELYNKTYNVK